MNKRSSDRKWIFEDGPESLFWDSQLYRKSDFKNRKNKSFRYYDETSFLKYLFYHWVNKWAFMLSKKYIEPYKYHPLPSSDQILKWYPIFSKHVSDGLVRLNSYHYAKSQSRDTKAKKPYKSILLRALFLTIWKRALVLIVGLIVVNVSSMSISILVKKLLGVLNSKTFNFIYSTMLLLSITVFQIIDGLLIENVNFHMWRLVTMTHYLFAINVFQHGMCHRRKFANDINGSNSLNACNQVLHSCSPDSECSKNPLFCQALRYQNKDIKSQMYSFTIIDSYHISFVFFAIKQFMDFLSNFCYGIYLLSLQVRVNIWLLYFVGMFFLFLMIVVEIINVIAFKLALYLRDYRLSKSDYIINSLSLIKTAFYDDIAINIITQSRNNELYMVFFQMFLTVFDLSLLIICVNGSFYIIKQYFVKSVNNASVITDIDTAGFMATFYIFLRIINSMVLVPMSIKSFGVSYVSFKRMGKYINDCSPNFYITGNPYTGSVKTSSNIVPITTQLPNDTVVYYRDATFTWVHTRDDLLNKKYEPYLKNVNFELKRGGMAIVTGAQGSGKSNFIKSMLGEMTLVGGSMAVVPLYTSMPIFYASQDIFLQRGTIRSNITFGYKFDENIYNSVLKAVELEFDISTWEKGDLRVVSDNAHSLSGGQRVRMELARAIYAYLVFHKVNREYNNSQCSFLMCLDASFHGLDPYVSKTIFNNLFNLKTGLLIKDDLSVVLTTSKQNLEICSKMSELTQILNPPLYKIKNHTLQFHSNLHDFVNNIKVDNEDYNYLSPNVGLCSIHFLTNDMLDLCSSGLTTKPLRMELTRQKYSESFKSHVNELLSDKKFNPYLVYIKPAIPIFVLYIIATVVMAIVDNVKLVLSTNLSDYITKHINQYKDSQFVDLSEIKTRSNFSFKITIILVSVIIALSIFSAKLFALSSFTSSRKIHEYSITSLLKNSSSVIKIKKEISQMITFLSCDIFIFDASTAVFISGFLYLLIQLLVNIITLLCLIPISIPFVLLTLALSIKYILLTIAKSCKNSQLAYLETIAQLNSACENAITGSSIYRTFTKQPEVIFNFTEDRDYNARTKFFSRSILVWSAITFNWLFSLTTMLILIALMTLDRFSKYKLKVGYFGLALSYSMSIIKLYSRFSILYTALEMFVCSVQRFRYFIPPGHKLKFDKCLNIHEEYVVNPMNKDVRNPDRKQLLRRRAIEFKKENKKCYGLRRLFYHPKIHILDVDKYITPEHTGVDLKDVCVYTTTEHTPESMILKHVSVSAHKSEIIGIIGRTGAGKTTLLSVLQNIIANRTGQVLLDGKDLNDIPKVVLRQIVGVLPQLPFVFKGWTVRRFLDPRKLFSDEEINVALNRCGLLNFVFELHGGKKLDTVLVQERLVLSNHDKYDRDKRMKSDNESDMSLSNTQLRTLSLARLVLYRHFFRVIVVDEPPEEDLAEETSSRSEDMGVPIYELLKHFSHCTTFVTAHNVNVLKTCTSVWVIHEGSLVRTCKASDIAANESIASIIEESVKYSH